MHERQRLNSEFYGTVLDLSIYSSTGMVPYYFYLVASSTGTRTV